MTEQAPPTPVKGSASDKKADEKKQEASAPVQTPTGQGDLVRFGNSFEIDLSARLKQYENIHTQAYKTTGINGDDGSYVAIICPLTLTPRSSKSASYARINGGPAAFLSAAGVIDLPKTGENYCFIYKDNLGDRIFDKDEGVTAGMKAENVLQKFVVPVFTLLKDMHDIDTGHGNIRLTNFYNGGKKIYDSVMVGECLSAPPSLLQPAIYEPLHRCSAQPIGRGPGMIQDDLYALGVCIAMLMRTVDPMAGKSEKEVIMSKLQEGTYATLIHKNDRFTGAILELLRGLLMDDQRQRWNVDDVSAWLDGRRLSPKQSTKRKKASRQLTFNGSGYFYVEAFANDMFQKPNEAVNLIEGQELDQWILRSIEDKRTHERFEAALSSSAQTGKGAGYADRLLSRVAIALDPEGPIRYKDLSLRPDGIGYALGEAFIRNANQQTFVEMLNSPLMQYWATTCTNLGMDVMTYLSKFESCKEFLNRPMIGYGLERCLYFLYPDIRCISPLLKGYFVRTPEDLVMAFDKMAKRNDKKALVIDRHMASFISTKDGKVIDSFLYDLNAPESHRKLTGLINVFALIQKSSETSFSVPHLTEWICDSLDAMIARYHDKVKRLELKKKLNKIKKSGDLTKIVDTIDDPEKIKRDLASFKLAMADFKTLQKEHATLEHGLDNPQTFGRDKAKQVGVIVSGIIASMIIMGYLISKYGGGGGGALL